MKQGRQRLDKWLWFARFAKSRSLAARLVTDGHVRVNGKRAEASATPVGVGDVVTVAAAHATLIVRILDLGERRGPSPEARGLYSELPNSELPTSPGAGADDH